MSVIASILSHSLVEFVLRIAGLALLAGAVTTVATFVYRARVRTQFPEGATLILGLGVVAIYLNTRLVFVQFVGEGAEVLTVSEAALNVTVFVVAGIASYGGRYLGDKAAVSDRVNWNWVRPNFSPIVRAAGRFITVTLPEDIEDIAGYDPVHDETKDALRGRTLDFPRGLTVAELQSQLVDRLKEDHHVGYVDVELASDGTVDFLAVGQRRTGVGSTLPPKSAAIAVRADPPFSATPGDTVQVWQTTDGAEERLGSGELRASVGSVVTVAIDEEAAANVDPTLDHRLMTLSADSYPDREFAAMLRRGDETMDIIEIGSECPLVGNSLGSLDVTVIAVRSATGDVNTIPKRGYVIQAGDGLFAIGRPENLRKLESTRGVAVEDSSDIAPPVSGADLTPASKEQ